MKKTLFFYPMVRGYPKSQIGRRSLKGVTLGLRYSLLGLLLSVGWVMEAYGQQARFVARPYDVEENSAVVFTYLENVSTIKFADIKAWKWDFDGDGTWDVQKTVSAATGVTADQITTTWSSALFKTNAGTGSATVRAYTPKLQITKQDNSVVTITGITEDVFGLDGTVDPTLTVRKKGIPDDRISVSFSANPRLARAGVALPPLDPTKNKEVRFYAEVSFAAGVNGQVTSYDWDLDGNGIFDLYGADQSAPVAGVNPNPTGGLPFNYPAPLAGGRRRYDVSLRVFYNVNGAPAPNSPITITKKDFIVIEDVPKSLSLGRAYRQGFPERYGWDDIILSYQAADGTGNDYVYFNHFEDAYFDCQSALAIDLNDPLARQGLAETVNEMLQGQSMRGFQGMINALRMRYPRLTGDEGGARLPAPAGARDETAALDTAALDFQQALQYAAFSIRAYGASVLRPGPDPSRPAPFPQFPNYLTYYDGSLSGADVPIPAKNEFWQLAVTAGGLGQARVEKAKLLWRLSSQDAAALPEAKEECKVVATQNYLSMALLATGQTADQFTQNAGNDLMANTRIATDLFDKINAGVNPLGTDGSYIPNESFAAIYQDATDAVGQAKAAEVEARNEKRTYDRNQADLRNELLAQRNQYITPLRLLTGIDPATYNNLATVGDQKDFRNAFYSRLDNLLSNYPNADPTGLGQYGSAVAAILDASLAVQERIAALNALRQNVEISRWANAQVDLINSDANAKLKASDIVKGYANSVSTAVGYPMGFAISFNPGSIINGYLNAADRDITLLQQSRIADVQLEAEIRKTLIEAANATISIRRAGVSLDQARLNLEGLKAQMERYIEDLQYTRNTAADLYFQDPSFRVFASQVARRAAAELEFSVDRLYRLAKTLQYEWTEAYQNPVNIPASCNEPPALESTLFDKFTRLDSLFAVRSADEAQDYLDALKAWDSKLRRINGTSVRGPNHSAPLSAVPISLRETILNFKPDPSRGYALEQSIADFRNYLETVRKANFFNVLNPSLEVRFPIGIEDNTYFPATGARWNMRIASVAMDVYSESGFSDQQVAEIDLIQNGMVTVRRFFANPPAADDLLKMTFAVDDVNRTAFAIGFPARINGATGGRPPTEFDSAGLAGRPLGTTDWILRINTENPANRNIDFSKIKDIVIRFTYTYGNPPEFPNF